MNIWIMYLQMLKYSTFSTSLSNFLENKVEMRGVIVFAHCNVLTWKFVMIKMKSINRLISGESERTAHDQRFKGSNNVITFCDRSIPTLMGALPWTGL